MTLDDPHPFEYMNLPVRAPDWSSHNEKFWFAEMIYARWNSNLEFEPYKLDICPSTGYFMIMSKYWPLAWGLIPHHLCQPAQDAYRTYVFEQRLLHVET